MIDAATRSYLLLKLAETLGVIAVMMIAGTSQRLKFRPVEFKYPQREKKACILLSILILAAAVIFYLTPVGRGLFLGEESQSLPGRLVFTLICTAMMAFLLYSRRQPLTSAGWGAKPNLSIGLRVGIILTFLVIILRGKFNAILGGLSAADLQALLWLLLICLAEETIFRGYLQLRMDSWLGKPAGWLITSGLFVIWQIPRLLISPIDFWINLAILAVQSVLAGWIMQKTGHAAAPALYRTISDWLTII